MLGLLLTAAVGCQQGPFEVAPVTGEVKLDGQPFVWGSVMFAPVKTSTDAIEAGKPAFGMLDSQGHFELSTYGDGDGAVVGPHRVTVLCVHDGPNGPPPKKVPEFNRIALRGDQFKVSADGENNFVIELTTDELRKYGTKR